MRSRALTLASVVGLIGGLLAGCGGTSSTTSHPGVTTPTRYQVAEEVELVKKIYTPYVHWTVKTPTLGNCFGSSGDRPCARRVADRVTPELKDRLMRYAAQGTGSDPVVCAQNTPDRVTYDILEVSGTAARIVVHTHYAGSVDGPIVVTVDLNDLELTGLTCPAP